MSDSLLSWADSFSQDWDENLYDFPSDPAQAESLNDFVGSVWNKYSEEYDASDITDLTSFISDRWDELDDTGLRAYLQDFEQADGSPKYLEANSYQQH